MNAACRSDMEASTVERVLNKTSGDRYIWLFVVLVSLLSMLAVYSATGTLAFRYYGGNVEYFMFRQLLIVSMGIGLMYVAHRIDYIYYSRIAQLLLFATIPLLVATLFFGVEINEARRWLPIPGLDLSFQTSDLARLALLMYVSRMLVKNQAHMHDVRRGFLPIVVPIIVVCLLILPYNFSTAAILFACCLLVLFLAGIPFRYFMLTLFLVVGGAVLLLAIAQFSSFPARIETWAGRLSDFTQGENESYQVQQAKIAISHGGLFGVGPGNSVQRNFLPSPFADFIYAIIIEEYGFVGGVMLIMCYLFFLARCIRIAVRCSGAFGKYLTLSLGFAIALQAFIHMAVVVDLLPTTGIPLPLISMGGTSIISTNLAIGIILSVSRHVETVQVRDGTEAV